MNITGGGSPGSKTETAYLRHHERPRGYRPHREEKQEQHPMEGCGTWLQHSGGWREANGPEGGDQQARGSRAAAGHPHPMDTAEHKEYRE